MSLDARLEIRLPDSLLSRLLAVADEAGETVAAIAREAIRREVARREREAVRR